MIEFDRIKKQYAFVISEIENNGIKLRTKLNPKS